VCCICRELVSRARDAAALRAAIGEWRTTLQGPRKREALQSLLRERLRFTPMPDGSGYSFQAEGTIESIVSGVVSAKGDSTGTRPAGPC